MRQSMIWMLFAVGVVAGCAAMAGLTVEALRVEGYRRRALHQAHAARKLALEAQARVQSQEKIGRAVWRLDSSLTPLIAQEATRDPGSYASFVQTGGTKSAAWQRSPLLEVPSRFIWLHFQVDGKGRWSSPQVPEGVWRERALELGIPSDAIAMAESRLAALQERLSFETLAAALPQDAIAWEVSHLVAENTFDYNGSLEPGLSQTSTYRQQAVQQILNQQQATGGADDELPESEVLSSDAASQATVSSAEFRDWTQRNRVFENFANSTLINQWVPPDAGVVPGQPMPYLTQPVWIGNDLLLARLSRPADGDAVVQGCWLNWPALQSQMKADVADLLDQVSFRPVREDSQLRVSQLLATLPVQIELQRPRLDDSSVAVSEAGPIGVAIGLAWFGLATTIVIGGVLLSKTLRLSERRATFVSSVTHELRTPLTTFRMYTDMLQSGMVAEPSKCAQYLATLHTEADRLSHLVENVLTYSRLEGPPRKRNLQRVALGSLLERVAPQLEQRVRQRGGRLVMRQEVLPKVTLETDELAWEQIITNLLDNACKYGQSGPGDPIELAVEQTGRTLLFSVTDSGPGIPPRRRRAIFRPFSKSDLEAAGAVPGIGLGLSLSRRLARELGGRLTLDTTYRAGARFVLRLPIK